MVRALLFAPLPAVYHQAGSEGLSSCNERENPVRHRLFVMSLSLFALAAAGFGAGFARYSTQALMVLCIDPLPSLGALMRARRLRCPPTCTASSTGSGAPTPARSTPTRWWRRAPDAPRLCARGLRGGQPRSSALLEHHSPPWGALG